MEARITHTGRDAGAKLARALDREGVTRIILIAGRYPIATAIQREIELIGMPGAILTGPLRISSRGKLRLVDVNVEGGIQVECFGVLHLQSSHLDAGRSLAALALGANSECLLNASVLDGGSGIALAVDDHASATINRCHIKGEKAAVASGPLARIVMGDNRLNGPSVIVQKAAERGMSPTRAKAAIARWAF